MSKTQFGLKQIDSWYTASLQENQK